MKRTWSARSYQEGDEAGIFQLWQAVYPAQTYDREQWLKWWRWLYKDNPGGTGWIWLAEDNGKIAGHSAIIPVALKIDSQTVTGFQSVNTMTHPDYRRQGIYEILAKKTYAAAGQAGSHIGFRFPNANSRPIALSKLDWFDVSSPQVWFKPYHWKNAIKLRIKNRFLSGLLAVGAALVFNKMLLRAKKAPLALGLTILKVTSFDERVNELWNRVSSQYPIMVVRDKDYLNWKYCLVPGGNYSIYIAEKTDMICGYLVFRCITREETKVGLIFDICAESEEIAQCLILKAIEECEQAKVDLIYCSLIANKMYLQAFRKRGFISSPLVKGGWFCAYSSSPHISREFLKNPGNWYVQTGDSDKL
ncbi:GNAT family N-acetyltransferase [Chloroflexota bacterium]